MPTDCFNLGHQYDPFLPALVLPFQAALHSIQHIRDKVNGMHTDCILATHIWTDTVLNTVLLLV